MDDLQLTHFFAYHPQPDQAEVLRYLLMASSTGGDVDEKLEDLMNREVEEFYYERQIRL